MASPEDSIRRVIDESVAARLSDQQSRMAIQVPDPLPLARADLLYLWDDYRTEMLDFAALNNPVGHRFGVAFNAVSDHQRYYSFTAPQGQHLLRWPVSYARALSESFSGSEDPPRQVLYAEGEREAVRMAVDLACRRTSRPNLAVIGTGHDWLGQTWSYGWDFDPVDALWEKLGAVLISPVDGENQVIRNGVVRRWMLAGREKGVPVIYDESRTGFGRLGVLWGQERSGLVADLTVLGGPVGGGLPLGAVIAAPEYFTGLWPSDVSPQAGHPWACAAGQSILEAVHPGVLGHVNDAAQALTTALDELVAQFPSRLSGHHGAGLLRGLRFGSLADAARFPVSARSHGLHLAPAVGPTVPLAPVLISSVHEVTRGVDLMADLMMSWEDG